ncbi:MAG: hypothetical protein GWM92_14135 [Gemmatimonadetes bacterium]|nr:hypothetical protein [Gemmatimonadota bacterium]NIR79865.1 hypothetical protein [Gemmatimonadota bacterium]NIT88586.1 hypothetical protein [Gemmatimonadota bacterium]NIU32405.1 hypothetical protein [Gemmatimonadota bacterium]NIU36905.1 hypothetical protein [Gemmatimonadota bacterium]
MRTLVLALVLSFGLPSCTSLTVEDDRPVRVSLVAMPEEAAVGEEIEFRASAEGTSLVRIEFFFGDGDSTTVSTFGSQEANATESHAYEEPGTFTASAVAVESLRGSARSEVTVTVVEN